VAMDSADVQLTTDDVDDVEFPAADRGPAAGQSNESGGAVMMAEDVDHFFTIYFSPTRFTAETVIAMVSAGINAAVLTTLVIVLTTLVIVLTTLVIGGRFWTHGHHSRTVYRCLFSNLALADCLQPRFVFFCACFSRFDSVFSQY